jgi:guanine deaminase
LVWGGAVRALRGRLFHLKGSSFRDPKPEWHDDGLLVINDEGLIESLGEARLMVPDLPDHCQVIDHRPHWILPGFVDVHTHFVQLDIIASHGESLLNWLERYTFPAEQRFMSPEVSQETARYFLNEMLSHGVTTASVYGSVHQASCDAVFGEAEHLGMRLLAGKTLMNRNAPNALVQHDLQGRDLEATQSLIERWHGRKRLAYSLTPRFAPTSTDEQMRWVGEMFQASLARSASTGPLFLQSHLAENLDECRWVASLYPDSRSYCQVYETFQQLGPGAIYGHCIHLNDQDRALMASRGASIAFCPSSNLFLGSGLFDLDAAVSAGIQVGLGTDLGAGTSMSMFKTMLNAYQVCKLRGQTLSPEGAFFLATLGGAQTLGLGHFIGNFEMGKEADLQVLDPVAIPLIERRLQKTTTKSEELFAILALGDERCLAATYVLGQRVLTRQA